jgi:hypothetical protein
MVNNAADDIRNFKQISFLPNTLNHQKDKARKIQPFRAGKCLLQLVHLLLDQIEYKFWFGGRQYQL